MSARVAEVSADRPGVIWIQEMLPRDQVIQFYSNAAVFCCPSVYEPFGIINLEAMACETAVVASAVGGIQEVVVKDTTGRLVPPADPRALAEAINGLLRDRPLAKRMGKAGRLRVEQSFSWV